MTDRSYLELKVPSFVATGRVSRHRHMLTGFLIAQALNDQDFISMHTQSNAP